MEKKPTVLFLCTGNSCRSQMAEGFLRHLASDRYEAISAGTEPGERVHPMAIEVMGEKDIDINRHVPKNVGEYLGRVSVRHLIVVCDGANERCPRVFPCMMDRMFWPFDDPAQFVGSKAATMERFRSVRDQIENKIIRWLAETA
jgi:arsenate reductase (thioredoxin)